MQNFNFIFKNPALDGIFRTTARRIFIRSNACASDEFLQQIANLLSENFSVLYVGKEVKQLDKNVYLADIFHPKIEKILTKSKKFDYVLIENINFLQNLPKIKSKLIAVYCTNLKNFKIDFKESEFYKFYFCDEFLMLKNRQKIFKYYFVPRKNAAIFSPNDLSKIDEKDIEFFLSCIKNGFKFYDFRKSRKQEVMLAFASFLPKFNDFPLADSRQKFAKIENKMINYDFLHSCEKVIKVRAVKKQIQQNSLQKKNFLANFFDFFRI